jgi:hypothetical protein
MMSRKNRKRSIIIQGFVTPLTWTTSDKIASVYIATLDGEEFYIEPVSQSEGLLDSVDEFVEVSGTLRTDSGRLTVWLESFRCLTSFDFLDSGDDVDELNFDDF